LIFNFLNIFWNWIYDLLRRCI